MIELNQLLRLARERTGRGLRETARAAGVSATWLSRLESGEQAPRMCPETLALVAGAYAVSPDLLWLACGRAPPDVVAELGRRPELLAEVRELFGDGL